MKYYLLLFAIALTSCSKEDNNPVPPVTPLSVDALIINDAEFTGSTKFAVGQYLRIVPSVSSSSSDLNFSWTLNPGDGESIKNSKGELSWRPAKTKEYALAVNVKSGSGEETSSKYKLSVIPADIRYYLWGARRADVEYTEYASSSEKADTAGGYVEFLVNHSDIEYGRKDALQPGEYIAYGFENDVLTSANVFIVVQKPTDPKEYKEKYEAIKSRLSDYNYLGNENKWLEGNDEAMKYKDTPERLGEAFAKGYVTLSDHFENERTNVTLVMLGRHEDGTVLMGIYYSQKK